MLRGLRIEKVVVRRDDQGRWSYKLVGTLDKLLGEKFFAVTDEALGTWIDEPDDVVEPIVQEAQDSCPRRGWKVLGSRFRFAAPLPVAA